jgi:hypothetical protein
MRKGTPSGPNICAVCKRKKDTALREQFELGFPCGHNQCSFGKEIKAALLARKKIKILPPSAPVRKIKILPPLDTGKSENKDTSPTKK